jgi:hypothetical protein
MSRISRVLLLTVVLVFVLACNFITRPLDQAQQAVETVQSIATALPIETLQAFPSALPEIEVPTGMPDIGMPTGMPDFGNMADPKDPPLTEWNGIPVIPSATSGNESSGVYSFKAAATTSEVLEYYKNEMPKLGWNEFFSMPDTGSGALLTFEKDNGLATITITASGDGVLVFLTSQ